MKFWQDIVDTLENVRCDLEWDTHDEYDLGKRSNYWDLGIVIRDLEKLMLSGERGESVARTLLDKLQAVQSMDSGVDFDADTINMDDLRAWCDAVDGLFSQLQAGLQEIESGK